MFFHRGVKFPARTDQEAASETSVRRRPRLRDNPRYVAVRLLARRPRSVEELRDRLRTRGFPEQAVAAVIDDLRAERLLDDERFAREYVEASLGAKPVGRRWFVAKLRRHRVPADVIERVLAETLPPDRERALARIAAERQRGRGARGEESADQTHARLRRFLYSRGFTPTVVTEVLAVPLEPWHTADGVDRPPD